MKKMFIGITGSTGGLGRRLSEILIERGFQLKCLVRNKLKAEFLNEMGVELVYGDINNKESLKSFVEGIDICIHIAAQVSAASKEQLEKVNVEGSYNICEALCRYNPTCRLIYCSSIVVKNYRPYKKPFYSAYTISKYRAEKVVEKFNDKLQITVIYPGYIYGYYDKLLIPMIADMLKNGLPFLSRGGEMNAPIVFVDDLCELFYQVIVNKKAIGKQYVSLEKSDMGIHDVVRLVADMLGYKYPTKVYPKIIIRIRMRINKWLNALFHKNYPVLSLREINILSNHAQYFNNAEAEIGWRQNTPIYEGVKKAVDWYRENNL